MEDLANSQWVSILLMVYSPPIPEKYRQK